MGKNEQAEQHPPTPVKNPQTVQAVQMKPPDLRSSERPMEARGDDGLEQVREILFGAMHRELERRLVRADSHLRARANELEEESRRRMEVLETHLRKETEALAARLERESSEMSAALRKLAKDQQDGTASLEQKLAKLEEAGLQRQRELRQQLLDQAKSFLDQLQGMRKELLTTMQQELRLAEGEYAEESYGVEKSSAEH